MTTVAFDNTTDLPLSVFTLNLTFNTIEALTNGNTTTVAAIADAGGSIPIWIGFIGCLVASIFFGSNFVPVKQFSAGDGFFFQFVFCVAVYMVGLIVDLIIKNEHWYPLVLIGGIRHTFSLYSTSVIVL